MADNHPTYGNGKICYIEIPANDIAVSSQFYQNTFGWHLRKRGDGNVAFDDGVGEVSGTWVLGGKPAVEPFIMIHIMVDNAEDALKLIVANGGTITQSIGTDAPEITAKFSDPAGNVFGIYQNPV
jgi:predicted enzyme related to lactoylglutathione lyase